MKILTASLFAGLYAISASISASGQHPVEEEILVTGARTPQLLSESLLSATVLTQADIEAAQVQSLADLLTRVPGIDIDQTGGRGSLTSLRMRGAESDHILVLVDGLRVAGASSGLASIQHIPVGHIARIEVVRGPRSSLYGAEAIGGVIQVFTKDGAGQSGPARATVRLGYASHDTFTGQLGVSGRLEKSWYSANVSHEDGEGIDSTINNSIADQDRDGYRETGLSASAGHTFDNDVNLELRYLRSEGSSEFDAGADDVTDFLNDTTNLRGSVPFGGKLVATLDLGYTREERRNFGANPSEFDTQRDSASLQFDYQLAAGQSVNVGYDFYDDQVESTANFIAGSRNNHAVFAQYLAEFDVISLQASLRNDDNEAFGSETTGSAAIGFSVAKGTTLSLSYGTAFKAPTFNDLYFPFTDFGFGFTYVGNPDLNPESSESVELLLRQQSSESLVWSLAVYQTDIEDLIQGTADFSTVENIAEAEIRGVEGSLDWKIGLVEAGLSLGYVDAEDANTGERLDRRSRFKAALDLATQIGPVDLAASWLYQGNRLDGPNRLGGFGLMDVRAAYQFSDDLRLGAKVENLWDHDYTLISRFGTTYRTEGRTFSAFASYSF